MNARLRAAVTTAEQLPDETQAAIAAVIEEQITAVARKRSLNEPRSPSVLDQREVQLDDEIAAGEISKETGEVQAIGRCIAS
ncbi:MAG: hypothetical protein H0U76_15990 [Ktedonobacteraceae bacterium]|nr:hypothetical protein [Ktedonobacteraceae bacterium]MBA3825188.1 hypothetical protein [Ktedonobacterales bacterium]